MKIQKFKNFFKKKKLTDQPKEEKKYKFQIGNYVKLNDEYIKEFGDEKYDSNIFKVIGQHTFNNNAGKDYDIYYRLIDINTNTYTSKYEIHLELVPEEEVHSKKYNL